MTKLAYIFPGQGSQEVGMLAELATQYTVVKETFAKASNVLNYDLWELIQNDAAGLSETDKTQPALLTASYAIWNVCQTLNKTSPSLMAGHSLGEYSALVCAGVIDFEQAVALVERRGQLMQDAVPTGVGAMSAIIGLENEKIAIACKEAEQGAIVSPVNFNSPGQVVIAGNAEAVARANELCKIAGAKRALPLPVSVPSHCALMKPAAKKLAEYLQSIAFKQPQIPIVNNVDVAIEMDAEAIKSALVRQLFMPVRWVEVIQAIKAQGVINFAEIGPGKVLTGLNKRIDSELTTVSVNQLASIEQL